MAAGGEGLARQGEGGLSVAGALSCGGNVTGRVTLDRREVVTVQLSRIMGDFVEAEARAGRPPEAMKARVETYLKAVEASVAKLGKQGRTVLVAEAVVAGTVPDLTGEVRADVARRMGAAAHASR